MHWLGQVATEYHGTLPHAWVRAGCYTEYHGTLPHGLGQVAILNTMEHFPMG